MSALNNIFITMRTNLAQLVGRDKDDGMHDGGSGSPLIETGGGNQQRGFVPSYGAAEFTDVQMVEGMSGRGWTTNLRPQLQQSLWASGRKKMALVFSLCAFACLLVGYGGFGGFFTSGEGASSTFLEANKEDLEVSATRGQPFCRKSENPPFWGIFTMRNCPKQGRFGGTNFCKQVTPRNHRFLDT